MSESLPPTSYIKTIDIWLLFNLSVPFALILLHTFMDFLKEYVYKLNLLLIIYSLLCFRQFEPKMLDKDFEIKEHFNRFGFHGTFISTFHAAFISVKVKGPLFHPVKIHPGDMDKRKKDKQVGNRHVHD